MENPNNGSAEGAFFGDQEPPKNPLKNGVSWNLFLSCFAIWGAGKYSSKRPHFGSGFGGALGTPKTCSVALQGRQDLPEWSPTCVPKTAIYKLEVGTYLGTVLATHGRLEIHFLKPNLAPCWPHASRQHEPMLDPKLNLEKSSFGSPI